LWFEVLVLSLFLFGGKFIQKAFFSKMSWFPTLKTKRFPYMSSVFQVGVMLTLFPAYMQRV